MEPPDMDENEFSAEPRRRYYLEAVAQFVESVLVHQPPDERMAWAALPALLRAHPYPFFFVPPSTRLVDVVRAARGA
jgi:hypothetical protein